MNHIPADFDRLSQQQIADMHGVSVRQVRRWTGHGMPRNPDGSYRAQATNRVAHPSGLPAALARASHGRRGARKSMNPKSMRLYLETSWVPLAAPGTPWYRHLRGYVFLSAVTSYMTETLTVPQLADLFGVTGKCVRDWIKGGHAGCHAREAGPRWRSAHRPGCGREVVLHRTAHGSRLVGRAGGTREGFSANESNWSFPSHAAKSGTSVRWRNGTASTSTTAGRVSCNCRAQSASTLTALCRSSR